MATRPSHDALSGRLEELFALAQVISPSADDAVALVRETFRRAQRQRVGSAADEPDSAEEQRLLLYRLLLEVRDENRKDSSTAERGSTRQGETELAGFRRRLAGRIVDDALPAAFASLTRDQRIVLMLCDIQGMTPGDAASVLQIDPNATRIRLDDARTALHRAIFVGSTDVERRLLTAGLSGDWMRGSLRRMIERELSAVPPTLEPSLVAPAREVPYLREPRPVERPDAQSSLKRIARRTLAVLLVIALAGLLGYGFSTMTSRTPDVNLISLSARQAGAVEVTFQTASAEQAERYVRDRLGRRVTVPTISDAALQGVSISDVSEGAEAPVILYGMADGTSPIVVYVYSYAFLDAHRNQLQLSADVLRQIEAEGHFDLHDLGEEKALVWRRRDDIYVAITRGDAETLRERISFTS